MAQGRITKRVVDGLKATGKEFFIWDIDPKGFGVRVQASGAKSYVFKYSAGAGRGAPTRRMTLARVGSVTPDEARVLAKQRAGEVVHGADPVMDRRKAQEAAGDTLRAVFEKYLAREAASLRTALHRRATFERLVFDKFGDRPIADIKRSEINDLLDKIEDENGPRMATVTLGYLGRVMNWYAARSDDFRSPLVRGMARGIAVKRDRVLQDEELRAFWRAGKTWDHSFSLMLRFVLLTATRRDEAADMQWSELVWTEALGGYLWTIRAERYKTKIEHEVPLSGAAWDVLTAASMPVALRKAAAEREALPSEARKQGEVIPKQGFVFTTNGARGSPASVSSSARSTRSCWPSFALPRRSAGRTQKTSCCLVGRSTTYAARPGR
jgi:integrase